MATGISVTAIANNHLRLCNNINRTKGLPVPWMVRASVNGLRDFAILNVESASPLWVTSRRQLCERLKLVITATSHRLAVLLLTVAPLSLTTRVASSVEFQLPEIIKILEERETAIQSLSVDLDYAITIKPNNSPKDVSFGRKEQLFVDFISGRSRSQATGDWLSDRKEPLISPLNSIGVFDGTAARTLSGTELLSAEISPNPGTLPMYMDPRQLSTRYYDLPISLILRERGAASIREVERDGMQLLAIETPEIEKRQFWAYRFELCPTMGFALSRSAQTVRFPFEKDRFEYTHITCADFKEIESGVWLPTKAIYESYDRREDDAKSQIRSPRVQRWRITASNWIVNPRVDDSLFIVDFPPGTQVYDKINGQEYIVAGITDELVSNQVGYAKGWASQGKPTSKLWLVLLNVVVVCVLLFIIAYQRLRRA